jgi:hypothetical protein
MLRERLVVNEGNQEERNVKKTSDFEFYNKYNTIEESVMESIVCLICFNNLETRFYENLF